MPIPTTPSSLPSLKRYLYIARGELDYIEQYIQSEWDTDLTSVERAVILLEDRRYFFHSGIDYKSVFREVIKKLTFRKHGGASTIEMQFVRTCTGYKELTLRRKIYEMFLAWALLHRATKLEILRSYLRIAYFGTGIRGISQVSAALFNKNYVELSESESFMVASMLVYPRPRDHSVNWQTRVLKRTNYGARLLTKIGPTYLK